MDKIKEVLKGSGAREIGCKEAHQMAHEFQIDPMELGKVLDELKIKIVRCQLGLFGYGPQKKDIPDIKTPEERLVQHINSFLEGTRLSCKSAWQIADSNGVQRKWVAGICEKLGIKINRCQLGAF